MPFIILKFFRIPIRIVGTGFGPISSSWLKPFIRLMLKKSDKVLLRDIESIEYAREIAPAVNYQLVTDLAQDKIFLDSELSAIKLKLPKKYIAIHVGVKPDSNLEFDILSELKELQLKKISIIFFSDSPGHNDNLIQHNVAFKELLKKSDNSVISIPYTDASEVINIIANATVILTGKLHVGIISCTYDVPVLSIPLHHKTERYYKHIENEQFCLCANDSFEIRKTKVKSFFNNIEEHTKPILKDKIMQSHAYAISEAIVE
jgi:polysaccharide pyruvyl transferase WcaK-like protein